MNWLPLASAVAGAIVALSGTLLADVRRGSDKRNRRRLAQRPKSCLAFMLAVDVAHGRLRDAAIHGSSQEQRYAGAARVLSESHVYGARERLLVTGTPRLVEVGEVVFARLLDIRDAIRAGASLRSVEYHNAYHDFAAAIWTFRLAVRGDNGQKPLVPKDIGRTSWSEREDCDQCAP